MNATQRKYLIQRINDICYHKRAALQKKYWVEAKEASNKTIYDALKKGKIKLRPEKEIAFLNSNSRFHNLDSFFDLSEYRLSGHYKEGFVKATRELVDRANELKDQVMLGGAEEALVMLKGFEEE
jgi:hypothetical protein